MSDVMCDEAVFLFALKSSVLFCSSSFLLLCLLQKYSQINLWNFLIWECTHHSSRPSIKLPIRNWKANYLKSEGGRTSLYQVWNASFPHSSDFACMFGFSFFTNFRFWSISHTQFHSVGKSVRIFGRSWINCQKLKLGIYPFEETVLFFRRVGLNWNEE